MSLLNIQDMGARVTVLGDYNDAGYPYYNPSLAYDGSGKLRISIRSCNFTVKPDGKWHFADGGDHALSKVLYGYLDADTLTITELKQLEYGIDTPIETRDISGLEDARIFWRKNGMHFSGVQIDTRAGFGYPAQQAEYVLDNKTGKLEYLHTMRSFSPAQPEKNWLPTDKPGRFDYSYSPTQVYRNNTIETVGADRYVGDLHGSSQLLWQPESSTYLAVLHIKHLNPLAGVKYDNYTYMHFFAEYNQDGLLIKLSKPFTFGTGENIEFASGMVEVGNDMMISFGIRDARLGIARLPKATFIEQLNDYDGTVSLPDTLYATEDALLMLSLKRDYDQTPAGKAALQRRAEQII